MLVAVRSARVRPTRRRRLRIVEANVADASGPLKAIWFNQAWLAERLQAGVELLLSGKLERRGDFRVEAHEILADQAPDSASGIHTTGLVAVHPASDALRAEPDPRVGTPGDRGSDAGARAVAGRAAGAPAAAGRSRRPAGAPLPRRRRAGGPGARATGARGAASAPGRARDPAPRASRLAAGDPDRRARGRRTGATLARLAALRAHRRPARRARRSRRATSTRAGRCSGC